MSSWGNQDNVTIQGNVIVAVANSVNVLGIGTAFTSNLKSGDYITIASNKYQVNVISSDTVLTLTTAAATTTVGANAFVQQGPKYISNVVYDDRVSNLYTIQKVFGVDNIEINVPENTKERGFSHTGWTHFNTYTNGQGQVRNKAEVLVAMSKNFSSNATNVLFGDDNQDDAQDDTVLANVFLFFAEQPTDNVTTSTTALFFVLADATPDYAEALITYQWQENNGTAFVNISDGDTGRDQNVTYLGNTTNTLSISNVTIDVDGYLYRVIISGPGGADSNTSDSAELTPLG